MTIRRKLLANLVITLLSLALCSGVMSWGAYRCDLLQKSVENVRDQIDGWLSLNFQVSQYLKQGLQLIVLGENVDLDEVTALTDKISHTFILLEKLTRAQRNYLSLIDHEQRQRRLIDIREQFGDINGELDKALLLLSKGQNAAASKYVNTHIVEVKLDRKFIDSIEGELEKEETRAAMIERSLKDLKGRWIALFATLIAVNLGLSALLMGRVNGSIQRSIHRAQGELLKGTQSIASGNLDIKLSIEGEDELSIVAEAFNKMAEELRSARALIEQQQSQLALSSKMSALGEMAGGIAHEINNPLAIIASLSGEIEDLVAEEPLDKKLLADVVSKLVGTSDRIARIIQGLRSFSRDGSCDPYKEVNVGQLLEDTLSFCKARLTDSSTDLIIERFNPDLCFEGRAIEVSQVLLNLLNNAHDAVSDRAVKWVKIESIDGGDHVEIRVIDSGPGIPSDIREKIFQPFFTTKEIGKGTGMGLSISLGIIRAHRGELKVDASHLNTCFVIRLPKKQGALAPAA